MDEIKDRARIIVADDHPVFREGMRRIVQKLVPTGLVQEASTFDEVLSHARAGAPPEIFVLDLLFPGFEPECSIRSLRCQFRRATIIVVSMLENGRAIERVMAAGADGFINKAVPPREIAEVIQSIQDGEIVILQSPQYSGLEDLEPDILSQLTLRQAEVLRLIAAGLSNKEIARQLAISPFTVRIHVSALLRLLGVGTRAAAAARAAEAGL